MFVCDVVFRSTFVVVLDGVPVVLAAMLDGVPVVLVAMGCARMWAASPVLDALDLHHAIRSQLLERGPDAANLGHREADEARWDG